MIALGSKPLSGEVSSLYLYASTVNSVAELVLVPGRCNVGEASFEIGVPSLLILGVFFCSLLVTPD